MLLNGIFMLISFSIPTLCFPVVSQSVNEEEIGQRSVPPQISSTSHLSFTGQSLCTASNDTSDTSLATHMGSFNVPNTAYTVYLLALPQCVRLDPYNIKYAFKAMDASLSLQTADEPVKSEMKEETGKVQLTLEPIGPATPRDPQMTYSEAMEVLDYTWGYLKVYKYYRPLSYSFLKMAQHVATGTLSSTVQGLGNNTQLGIPLESVSETT
ncbi:MAG: hypothetical protein OHK93_001882 [Ramalina farinacea]|uniref:Uncharacterized protein n=1 Tax=Ramalina farinacea TaxID=258253 RepID=A0AA43QQB9_9LECA|nr:hypothetical protein [Ramalina farinacea]